MTHSMDRPLAGRRRQLRLTAPVSLFFIGGFWAIVLLSGLALLVSRAFQRRWNRKYGFATVADTVALSILAQMILTNTLAGFIGTLFRRFIGSSTAPERHWAAAREVPSR